MVSVRVGTGSTVGGVVVDVEVGEGFAASV
jgi:hypothetical protein